MFRLNVKALLLFPLLTLLIKSQSIDPMMLPKQEISTTETESNKGYLWSTTSSPEVKQTTSTVLTVATRPPIASNPYFTDMIQPQVEERFRSENFPYIYDTVPNYQYPLYPQNPEQSVGPTSKHFVVVSFIGLLLLFAIIQNTLLSAKRKEGLLDILSRRKRDLIESRGLIPMSLEQEYILNDDAKLRCIQRTVCSENRKLLKDLGIIGKVVAKYLIGNSIFSYFSASSLSSILSTKKSKVNLLQVLIEKFFRSSIKESLVESSGWNRLVEDAGAAGLRGEDCNVLYRGCNLHSSLYIPKKNEQDQNENEQGKPKLKD